MAVPASVRDVAQGRERGRPSAALAVSGNEARLAEPVDARGLKPLSLSGVRVRIPERAPFFLVVVMCVAPVRIECSESGPMPPPIPWESVRFRRWFCLDDGKRLLWYGSHTVQKILAFLGRKREIDRLVSR